MTYRKLFLFFFVGVLVALSIAETADNKEREDMSKVTEPSIVKIHYSKCNFIQDIESTPLGHFGQGLRAKLFKKLL